MKKIVLSITCVLMLSLNAFSQDYTKSGISFAVSSGAGFLVLNQVNGGGYGQTPYNFKPSSLYWGASFEVKRKLHGFGIEYENQKFGETKLGSVGVNIQDMKTVTQLDFSYFNLYYKFYIPFEYKKINPYLKASLILPIYAYSEERTWTNSNLSTGSDSSSNAGMGGSFAIHAGANYHINDMFSAFTELGYGPVIWKLGARISFLPN